MAKSPSSYVPFGSVDVDVDGEILNPRTSKLESLPKLKHRYPKNAEEMRDLLCDYVNSPGAIPWQLKILFA